MRLVCVDIRVRTLRTMDRRDARVNLWASICWDRLPRIFRRNLLKKLHERSTPERILSLTMSVDCPQRGSGYAAVLFGAVCVEPHRNSSATKIALAPAESGNVSR